MRFPLLNLELCQTPFRIEIRDQGFHKIKVRFRILRLLILLLYIKYKYISLFTSTSQVIQCQVETNRLN